MNAEVITIDGKKVSDGQLSGTLGRYAVRINKAKRAVVVTTGQSAGKLPVRIHCM